MQEEILKIYVKIEDDVQVNGTTANIKMIWFTGYAKSKYFEGNILPGGVDLQSCKQGERVHLSARYVMEGKDAEGNECRIYVENNGYTDENGEIRTIPTVITDSKVLSWMETAKMEGSVSSENDMVVIRINKCDE